MEALSDELLLLVFQLRDSFPSTFSQVSRGAFLIFRVVVV